ncbi:MAG: S-adenosylmethionine:tRNA ribosyltransferase-isomerase, partial [Proteobacteria bacterium]|nr:S-adenosylmethionine:tRNA ribosyltransferase-isomerase [Pseudomonadota bacterium]
MQLSEFGYELPPERIATAPARPRDSARLLHVAADG